MNLRNHLIRLAHAKPELRPLLLPLLKEGRGSAAPALKQEPGGENPPPINTTDDDRNVRPHERRQSWGEALWC